jgi:hypothetical protein
MRGTPKPIPLPRRFIFDLMQASNDVPLITLRRTLQLPKLAAARAQTAGPPGFAALFAKAFSLIARDEPILRTVYACWPWPQFYQLPQSVAMIAVARKDHGTDCVLMMKLAAADEISLREACDIISHAKTAAICDVAAFRKIMRVTRLPWPLRRLAWRFALSIGRQRANHFGTFAISSVAAFGPGELHPIGPGPYIVSYGVMAPDASIDVVFRFDHRLADAAMASKTLTRLEQALNGPIANELADWPRLADRKPIRAAGTP